MSKMGVGAELDYLISEKVFGIKITQVPQDPVYYAIPIIPPYSSDIRAAWLVVETLVHKFAFNLDLDLFGESVSTEWCAYFGDVHKEALTAPHAICLAALAALESKMKVK